MEAGRGCQITWNWSFSSSVDGFEPLWVLVIELQSSGKAAIAVNGCAISSAPRKPSPDPHKGTVSHMP